MWQGIIRNTKRFLRKHSLPICEELDPRMLLTTAALAPGGTLTVTGTSGADAIIVNYDPTSGQVSVLESGHSLANSPFTGVNYVVINGGDGNDEIDAGLGNVVFGTLNCTIDAGDGDDTANGGPGDDIIIGGYGNDHLCGYAGYDEIWGGWGNDVLEGNDENDYLYGEGGDDECYGGNDNDVIDGGGGADRLFGQNGDDHFASTEDGDTDEVTGGLGTDWIDGYDYSDIVNL